MSTSASFSAPPPSGSPSRARTGLAPDLSERTAVVTGGASGIGRACAAHLAAAGAKVTVLDRDEQGAQTTAKEIGGEAVAVDLADLAAVDALGLDADVVVNNAGVQHVAPVQEFPPEQFSLMLRLMVEAPFRIVRQVLPGMYDRGWGRVVNISSVHGRRASAYKSAYVTAKHALEGLSKALAVEGAPHGVTSNCVSPGYVRTPLVEGQLADQSRAHGMPEEQVVEQVLLARTPRKALVEPDEVAALVVWLTGPQAASVTGASLAMDGGWTAT